MRRALLAHKRRSRPASSDELLLGPFSAAGRLLLAAESDGRGAATGVISGGTVNGSTFARPLSCLTNGVHLSNQHRAFQMLTIHPSTNVDCMLFFSVSVNEPLCDLLSVDRLLEEISPIAHTLEWYVFKLDVNRGARSVTDHQLSNVICASRSSAGAKLTFKSLQSLCRSLADITDIIVVGRDNTSPPAGISTDGWEFSFPVVIKVEDGYDWCLMTAKHDVRKAFYIFFKELFSLLT